MARETRNITDYQHYGTTFEGIDYQQDIDRNKSISEEVDYQILDNATDRKVRTHLVSVVAGDMRRSRTPITDSMINRRIDSLVRSGYLDLYQGEEDPEFPKFGGREDEYLDKFIR